MLPVAWTHRRNGAELTWLGNALNVYYRRTLWLRPSFWRYFLAPRDKTAWGSWLSTVWCRFRGHPGEIFYNAGGLEPDHRCKRCGETVG